MIKRELFNQEHEAFRVSVRRFIEKEIAPYHAQWEEDGVVPRALVLGNTGYRPEMVGFDPPRNVYAHIIGTDIVRTGDNEFFVLAPNYQ